jgi:hypothetical protein
MEVSSSNIERATDYADLGFPPLSSISQHEFRDVTSKWAMPASVKLPTLPTYYIWSPHPILRYITFASEAPPLYNQQPSIKSSHLCQSQGFRSRILSVRFALGAP